MAAFKGAVEQEGATQIQRALNGFITDDAKTVREATRGMSDDQKLNLMRNSVPIAAVVKAYSEKTENTAVQSFNELYKMDEFRKLVDLAAKGGDSTEIDRYALAARKKLNSNDIKVATDKTSIQNENISAVAAIVNTASAAGFSEQLIDKFKFEYFKDNELLSDNRVKIEQRLAQEFGAGKYVETAIIPETKAEKDREDERRRKQGKK